MPINDDAVQNSLPQSEDVFSWLLLDSEKNANGTNNVVSPIPNDPTPKQRWNSGSVGTISQPESPETLTNLAPYTQPPFIPTLFPPFMGFNNGSHPLAPTINSEAVNAGGDDSDVLSKKRRLEKNRESARECRRRKKEQVAELQQKLAEVEQKNLELRLRLKDCGKDSAVNDKNEKDKFTENLASLVDRGANDDDVLAILTSFADRYADYGQDRRAAMQYHLDQVIRLLVPTQVTKMAMWCLQQDDTFYTISNDNEEGMENGLWNIITTALNVVPQQQEKLAGLRTLFKSLGDDLSECFQATRDLKEKIHAKNVRIETAMEEMMSILTPKQCAEFIQWVTNNQPCIHMLNKLWRT